MKQMHIPEDILIAIDYTNRYFPASARTFRPAVYKDGDFFCAVLGENPHLGIFGCGRSTDEAIEDWAVHFQDRLDSHLPGDDLVQYIQDTLSANKNDVY